jgi:hypothetical protein
MSALPNELWTRIFTHPDLVAPVHHPAHGSTSDHNLRINRRQVFASVSLTCRQFHTVFSDPYVRAVWAMTFHGGSVRDTIFFIIARGWVSSLSWILVQSAWLDHIRMDISSRWDSMQYRETPFGLHDEGRRRRQSTLNDALIYAVCNQGHSRHQMSGASIRMNSCARLALTKSVPVDRCASSLDWYLTHFLRSYDTPSSVKACRVDGTQSDGEESGVNGWSEIDDILDTYTDVDTPVMVRNPFPISKRSPYLVSNPTPRQAQAQTHQQSIESNLDEGEGDHSILVDMVRQLLDHGADLHVMQDFPVRRVSRNGCLPLLNLLIA